VCTWAPSPLNDYLWVLNSRFGGFSGGGGGGGEIEPEEPTVQPQDPLPFNNCKEFVNYLVGLGQEAFNAVRGPSMADRLSNAGDVARRLGSSMIYTARFEYARHINNGADGFKDKLTRPGNQGSGVYAHILGLAGAVLMGHPFSGIIGGAQVAKDIYDSTKKNPQSPAEMAGNRAGFNVGHQMSGFLGSMFWAGHGDANKLRADLEAELCQ
jgi:hypothetical protein